MERRLHSVAAMKLVVLLTFAVAATACDRASSEPAPTARAVASLPAGIHRVADRSLVCMVNDQLMGKAQIPVEVQGRTYYGCCAMCKERLANQAAIRTARDPVSGEAVDKATAIIVHDDSGAVYYFASEDTLRRYQP